MTKYIIPSLLVICLALQTAALSQTLRSDVLLERDWKFSKGDFDNAMNTDFDDAVWESVVIPHDWAIYGPFDMSTDEQNVAIEQNLETKPSVKTGRTGGLPFVGIGWYRTTFNVPNFAKGMRRVSLVFDGAMSEAKVFVNGKEAGFWAYGYNSFHLDVTDFINEDGKDNTLAVRLENLAGSSRWYPGAGLYRNVHLVTTSEIHVPVWGTYVTTPFVSKEYASVCLKVNVKNVAVDETVCLVTKIVTVDNTTTKPTDNVVAERTNFRYRYQFDEPFEQNFIVNSPKLWSPETPNLYCAITQVFVKEQLVDEYTTRFGIRDIKYIADKGFFLNGESRKFKGVCNHHDLGALGSAINESALRRQLTLLKEMGCDAIRTSHNMPAPELVQLCDEMGLMMMVESFDEWDRAKCRNGYNRYFNEWAEKDMVNMIHHYRNNPCVVMWSIGNEVPTQYNKDGSGYKVALFLQNICHREDPTRPVTSGLDGVAYDIKTGFAAVLDIPGLNYRTAVYEESYKMLPHNLILGAETASTISSRGVYKFPVELKAAASNKGHYADFQCSSYDVEVCSWSNVPEVDFALADDFHWEIGQFVWTGFDYLGEPTPYDAADTPNHSSMFGIIDIAFIPKDRYYLYRSVWNTESDTLHIVPHWTWKGREGEVTPVYVYTNYPSAELFINGKSQGRRTKAKQSEFSYKDTANVLKRYRLMWNETKYEPGELRVVAYDANGKAAAEKTLKTAGEPARVELVPDRGEYICNGKDLAYVNVRVVDKDGNLCPLDQRLIEFDVSGEGKFRAAANGDPTSLEQFHLPKMHVFYGQLTAIVQTSDKAGNIKVKAKAEGLETGEIELRSK
ncbi:MAG: DUF4982 domain-containing protein [Planctomycetaceae bacterium]|jgi:beta-galactosidase|nr:DUF4982 domain-containing protein [Planctomycetaceae bacterium]